jgi:hypothetical protein
MEKIDVLEQKIRKILEELNLLRKENLNLKETLKELENCRLEIEIIRSKRDKARVQVDDIIKTVENIQLDFKL